MITLSAFRWVPPFAQGIPCARGLGAGNCGVSRRQARIAGKGSARVREPSAPEGVNDRVASFYIPRARLELLHVAQPAKDKTSIRLTNLIIPTPY